MPKIRGVKPDFWTDEDVCELSPFARLLFIGMWNWCCDNGHIQDKPKQIKRRVLPDDDVNATELLREIEAQRLIERADGWITVPNLTFHQKPDIRYWLACDYPGCEVPERTVSQRAARRAHGVRTKGKRSAPTGDTPCALGDGDGDGEVMVKGNEEDSSSEIADATPDPKNDREDIQRVCDHLADRIEANGSKRPNITKGWQDAARLMIDRDGRTEDQVHRCIDWCQDSEFWRGNILSMPKLREKYDQLRLKATEKPEQRAILPAGNYYSPPPPPDDMPTNLFAAWNRAHNQAHRDGKPGPDDWHELEQAS